MNKNDYIAQVDSIEFSPDLEEKLLKGTSSSVAPKKHFVLPLSFAACVLLVITLILIPATRKNGMTDGAMQEAEEYKTKTTLYSTQNFLADTETALAGGTVDDVARLLHCLTLGENVSKDKYETEAQRLRDLGYDASVYENNGDITTEEDICILIALLSKDEFPGSDYDFTLKLITQ